MIDEKDVQYYDIIDGGTVNMDVYTIYVELIKASVFGHLDEVLMQGFYNNLKVKLYYL